MKLKKIAAAALSALMAVTLLPSVTVAKAEELKDSGMDYTESTETIGNPGMGYTTTFWYYCKPGETNVKSPQGNVVLMFIDIGAFSCGVNGTTTEDEEGNKVYTEGTDYDLDSMFFEALQGTFENCRRNGSTIALRFRYDGNGKTNPEPASFEQLLHHIDQIKESGILEDYKDILMFVESGFVGAYGEQWGGKYTSLEHKAQLLDAMLDLVPDDIPVTVRTPNIFAKWAGITTAEMADWVSEPGSKAARVGMYNDGYMGSDSDLGTYSNRPVETAWLGKQTVATYYGGEFSGNLEWAKKYDTYYPENAIPEMYATHLSYINGNIYQLYKDYTFGAEYDVPNVDNSAYYGETVFKFIRDHLGYRFTVRDCDLSASVAQGGSFDIEFSVENTGFANPIRPQNAELILEKDGIYITAETDIDSRLWRSCTTSEEKLSVKIPASLEAGEWNVYLRLSVGEQDIPEGNFRTVQFTNHNVWNATLGANRMGSIQVKAASGSTDQSFSVNGAATDNAIYYQCNNTIDFDGIRSSETEWMDELLAAEDGDNRIWLTADEEYLYVATEIQHNVEKPVFNLRILNEDNGESYWYYQQPAGWVYYNHGDGHGILMKRSPNYAEFKIPFSAMEIQSGTKLGKVRIFVQDEPNAWAVVGDLTAENYTVNPSCTVYSAYHEVSLSRGQSYTMRAVTDTNAKYTWLHDGKEIGTGEYLKLSDVSAADEGLYSVRIVTANGTVQVNDICRITGIFSGLVGDVDLDGDVDAADAALLQRYLLKKNVSIPGDADINGDGIWDVCDLVLLKRLCIA